MKYIIANWKMNYSFAQADGWLDNFWQESASGDNLPEDVEIVLCPPAFIIDYIDMQLADESVQNLEQMLKQEQKQLNSFSEQEISNMVSSNRFIRLGAQDCHQEQSGSFTGDISASMLKEVGCEYVILGHSERREYHFESDELINRKIQTVAKENLIPIVCVGENKEIRNQGRHIEFVYQQLLRSIPQNVKFKKLMVAYEPIWSIGTGEVPSAAQILEMVKLIRKIFAERLSAVTEEFILLYGGSVSAENSKEILAISGIDGLLVGKASLDAKEFYKICLS